MTPDEAYKKGQVVGALAILTAITDDLGPKRGWFMRKQNLMLYLEATKVNVARQGLDG